MNRLILICLVVSLSYQAHALVVVVGKSNPVKSLSKTQVIDIYMGRYNTFPGGVVARPLDRVAGSDEKQRFYRLLVSKSEEKINSYWARLLFSGRASPPSSFATNEEMLDELRNSEQTIGYVLESEVDDSLKVVYRFKK
jgi:ABC-type phosphate transport system substrate-binding protein